MNPKAEIFFDAVTSLPEEIVEEAQEYRFRRKNPWVKYAGLAACVALAVLAGWYGGFFTASGTGGDSCAPEVSDAGAPQSGGAQDVPEASGDRPEEAVQFTAKVIEVLDTGVAPSLLVEPLEGEAERDAADRIVVTVDGDMPVLAAGDLVRIAYDGFLQESYPARIARARSVEKIEE